MKKKIFGIISLIIGITLVFAFTAMSLTGCKNPGGDPVLPTDVTYTAIQYGGIDGEADSTGIVFTFSESVSSLTAANITVGGKAVKGEGATLNGSRNVWTLSPITVSAAGLATVSIAKNGIDAMEQNVIVHKEGEATPQYWSVTWNLNGGAAGTGAKHPILVEDNTSLTIPSPYPARNDYTFHGWYTDSNLTEKYNFAGTVTANLTLYAKWVAGNWSKVVDDDSTATLDYSVNDEGTCTITLGGTPEPDNRDWKARALYNYTAQAKVSYIYEFEAWTDSDSRTLWPMYYGWADDDYWIALNEKITLTTTPTTFTIEGLPLPKGGNRQLIFQAAHQTGTFYVKVLSITPSGSAAEIFPLIYEDGGWWNHWAYKYDVPSSVTGGKITAGDEYTFTYSFKSNVAITGDLNIHLVDNSAGGWTELSSYIPIASNISANTAVSGTVTLHAAKTASSATAAANRMMFVINPASNAAGQQPILFFTDFSLVKGVSTPTAPTITTTSLAGGTAGTAYSQTLTATGTAPITWSIDTGDLPNGVSLNSTTGVISGTPTTAGTFNFTVKATNAVDSNTKALSIVIGSGGGDPSAPYIITGNTATEFTATRNNAVIGNASNNNFDSLLLLIAANANGEDCTIQFGDGTNVLDIGTDTAEFYAASGWGTVTLTGKITGNKSGKTISVGSGRSIISTADIANTNSTTGNAIYNNGGTITIAGGTVSGNKDQTIYNSGASSKLIITNGTVKFTGTSNIDSAIMNSGDLTISNGMIESSAYGITHVTGTLTMNGGTVKTTNNNSNAIQINGGTVTINNGTVSATNPSPIFTGFAVANGSSSTPDTGTITIKKSPAVIIGQTYGTIIWE